MSGTERGLTFYESEVELLEAAMAAESGDETALAILPEYLEFSFEKRDRVAMAFRIGDQQMDFCDAEIARLKERKERIAKAKQRLATNVIGVMRQLDVDKLEGKTSTLAIRTNPPSVVIEDESKIPQEYKTIKQTVVINKQEIGKALKAGADVPGADLSLNNLRLAVS